MLTVLENPTFLFIPSTYFCNYYLITANLRCIFFTFFKTENEGLSSIQGFCLALRCSRVLVTDISGQPVGPFWGGTYRLY